MDKYSQFFQEGPKLHNTYQSDQLLQSYLKSKISQENQNTIISHLNRVGEMAAGQWWDWSKEAEQNKPKLIQYDEWGKRVDEIQISQAWQNLEAAAATEGIVATAYERKFGWNSRVYQMALLYLYHPSSAFFSCPLAMTDGAARALELHAEEGLKKHGMSHLLSRDPKSFWTAGQWMTERTGGSDVSGTSTVAKQVSGRNYKLYGTKWFTSATKSQMAMTLARIENEAGEKSKSLSLFYLEKNNIEVHRLKDKLGTDALPTAELSLNGTEAILVGEPGEGVKRIASILNITRLYNSICAIGHMRRALDLAKSYAERRFVFGKNLSEHGLHQKVFEDLENQFEDCFKFTFEAIELLGKEETGVATEEEKATLRALTPLVKLFTAKKCMHIVSEVVECFGGAGYVENTGIPRLLRDAQVFSIWEGTTNVLSLDFLRACEKEKAHETLVKRYGLKSVDLKKIGEPHWARQTSFSFADEIILNLR